MRVAAIDCGTNSIRLLVLSGSRKAPVELVREVRLARLGQGVDATGEFHPDALARTFAVCEEYARIIREHGAEKVRFVATSAARDVSNRRLLVDGVRERLGVEVDVIPGQEEARLSSMGALCALDVASPTLVVDIGGGSTELVLVDGAGTILHSVSLNVGAVRLRERFLHTDPPTPGERKNARGFVGELLDGSGIDFAAVAGAVGVRRCRCGHGALVDHPGGSHRAGTLHAAAPRRGDRGRGVDPRRDDFPDSGGKNPYQRNRHPRRNSLGAAGLIRPP